MAKLPAELLVAIGRRPKSMIQVRKADEGEVTVLGKVTEKDGEGNGVRAAREPDEHAATGRAQAMPLNRPANPLMQRSHQGPVKA